MLGRLGTPVAPLANWTLRAEPLRRPRRAPARHPPRRARAAVRRPDLPALGADATAARPPTGASSTSTAAAPTTTSPGSGRWSSPSSSTTASTWSSRRRTAAGCRCSRTATSRRRATYVRRLVANLAPYARDGLPIVSNSTSCSLMLKREAREILGVEDDDLKTVSEATYDLCEFLLLMHERGELRTDFQAAPADGPVPRALPAARARDRQAGARPARADPRPAGDRAGRRLLRDRRDVRPEEGEVRDLDGRRASGSSARCASRRRTSPPVTARRAAGRSRTAPAVHAVHPVELLHRAYGLDRPPAPAG